MMSLEMRSLRDISQSHNCYYSSRAFSVEAMNSHENNRGVDYEEGGAVRPRTAFSAIRRGGNWLRPYNNRDSGDKQKKSNKLYRVGTLRSNGVSSDPISSPEPLVSQQ